MKDKKWYDNIVGKHNTREKLYGIFENLVKTMKKDGFSKEEARLILIGSAAGHLDSARILPLELHWLDKYWEEIE